MSLPDESPDDGVTGDDDDEEFTEWPTWRVGVENRLADVADERGLDPREFVRECPHCNEKPAGPTKELAAAALDAHRLDHALAGTDAHPKMPKQIYGVPE